MALSDDILDATVRHSIYLERHKAGVIRRIIGMVGDVNDEIIARIINAKIERLTRRQLDQLLANMRRAINSGYSPVIETLDEEVRQLGIQEVRFQKRMLENVIPVRLTFDVPSDEQIYAAATARPFEGRLLREWYSGLPDGSFRRVRDAIRMGYVEGQTTDQIVRTLRGTRDRAGIIDQSKRGAEAAVRTALAHTANVAKGEVYKKNRSKIKGVEWVSTLDGRTSAICRGFDGKVFPVDEGPRPPAHVACRSTTIPVIKTARQLGLNLTGQTRASMNGQVSAELNYDQWLRRQPLEFQDDVLGKKKAQLFRAGLTMDRFIDREGAELTLREIEEREAEIWARAFGAPPQDNPQPEPEPQAPQFTWQDIPKPRNVAEAEKMAMQYVAEVAKFGISSNPAGIYETVSASREVMERFNLGKMGYMGTFKDAPVRYRVSRNATAAFAMKNDHYLANPKGTKVDDIAQTFTQSSISVRNNDLEGVRQTMERGFTLQFGGKMPIAEEVKRRFAVRNDYEWSPVRSARDVAYHENGHRFHGKHLDALDRLLEENSVMNDGWHYLVSKYAKTNSREYIAETFTIYMQGDQSQFYRIHPQILAYYRQQDVLG